MMSPCTEKERPWWLLLLFFTGLLAAAFGGLCLVLCLVLGG